ncbi:LysR substrate-binding domain-containing protein, partial [Vibrio sp.]|nr:LysR substrate-binding domain-containing protein [Vibrio sp.]
VNILHKQPRLTVTNFDAKCRALLDGLGIGTMPKQVAEKYIEQGRLKLIEGSKSVETEIIMVWRRNKIGEAKSWCIQYLKKHWSLR